MTSADCIRICYAVDLHDNAEIVERYKVLHMPGAPPAEVTASLRAAGITALEIYSLRNRLFMIMEVNSQYDPNGKVQVDAHIPEVQAWNALMETMQQEVPFSSSEAAAGKWRRMQRIYDLSSQP